MLSTSDDSEEPLRRLSLQGATAEDFLFSGEESINDGVNKASRSFRMGAGVCFLLWIVTVFFIWICCPDSIYEEPQGVEREIYVLSILFMVLTNGSRMLNMVLRQRSRAVLQSGIIIASLVVQGVALWSNAWMAFFPSPVMLDPISGQRFYLVRWAEWVALTFLMSFLTYNIDHVEGPSFVFPALATLSTACAFVFPHCTSMEAWLATLFVSTALFLSLFFVVYQKAVKFSMMKETMMASKRPSAVAQELYQVSRYSYVLSMTCAVTWTTLVATFILVCLFPDTIPLSQHLSKSTLLVIHNCINEVSSKYYYFSVLTDAYEMVFESNARLTRRLEESRGFMSAVWESSSDVIVFASKKSEDRVCAYVSMAFLTLMDAPEDWASKTTEEWDSLFLDINPQREMFTIYLMNTSMVPGSGDAIRFFNMNEGGKLMLEKPERNEAASRNLTSLARLVMRAFDGSGRDRQVAFIDSKQSPISCEATISRLKEDKIVVVLRDITDRIERFEAEKSLVQERAIRDKDAQINHFTRHEVKNGILTAMGLIEQLRERVDSRTRQLLETAKLSDRSLGQAGTQDYMAMAQTSLVEAASDAEERAAPDASRTAGRSEKDHPKKALDAADGLNKLDSALGEVLDTVLDEAMAREIIHGDYVPTMTGVEIEKVLSTLRKGVSHKYPLTFEPRPFPSQVVLDRQLLRYIYRNAFSNACKHGRKNGVVKTEIYLDIPGKQFLMNIINEPAPNQDVLARVSENDIEAVFAIGTRLPGLPTDENTKPESSAASGAWVMRKCAEALGGTCSIRFDKEETCFWFSCPAKVLKDESSEAEGPEFGLPENVWIVILEDSEIQRKLLNRCFARAGVPLTRRVLLGKNADEVYDFRHLVASLMAKNPHDKFLLIVDENLDILSDGGTHKQTVSGSTSVRELRDGLPDETEARMLALIRSANDSAKEIAQYLQRAHGFLRKEPVRRGQILRSIEPYWKARFPSSATHGEPVLSEEPLLCPSPEDIRKAHGEINALREDGDMNARWPSIREKLHVLKGDLMTMSTSMSQIISNIDELRSSEEMLPDFDERWNDIQKDIEKLL